jgi:hypothetical protein
MAGFTVETLEAAVTDLVVDLTGSRPAPEQPLAAQGLDSLAAMELRQKLQARACLCAHCHPGERLVFDSSPLQHR